MRRSATLLLGLLVAGSAGCPRPQTGATTWRDIRIPPLRSFRPQQPRRVELGNGMVIFLQEDHELPLVGGYAIFHGGSEDEPAAKTGLVDIFGDVWRTGGTEARTGDALDDYLEARAAKVETFGDGDSTAISFSCLKADFADVFKVFLEVMRNPAFRKDKIRIAQRQLYTAIARRNDSISSIAGRESAKLAYGFQSPLARHPEYATVAAVKRADLLAWHRRYVQPNNMLLGIAGDFDGEAMERHLRAAFGRWKRGPKIKREKPRIAPPAPGLYFAAKDDVNQSQIRMVHLGTTKRNPDFYAIAVMNEIFGASSSSRLFLSIRSKLGLAYAVGGGVGTSYVVPGVVRLSVGTKSGSTAAALQALLREVDELQRRPVTAQELRLAKDSILNSFIFQYDSRMKTLRARIRYEFYGYPRDFLERFPAGVRKVTAADVLRVARKYIHKKKLRILVVGKAADFDRPLAKLGLGEVKTLDIRIPPPPK